MYIFIVLSVKKTENPLHARLVSNLHVNLGGLYRMNGHPDLAREHMGKSISLLDQFNLLHINDSIPKIANYAMFLTEQQEPERGISELQKLSGMNSIFYILLR